MSTSAITSSLLSQILNSPSEANQFASDLNQVAKDLQTGDLSSAQQDYVTLTQDALNGTTSSATTTTTSSGFSANLLSSIGSSSSSSDNFVGELNQLGADLSNGDLSSAQEDMLSLNSTALGAASAASSSTSASTSATSATAAGQSLSPGMQADIQAIIQAMRAGDTSDVSAEMSQLASDAGNSPGASYIKALSGGSSTTSASNPTAELLQSMNDNSSSLNLLA